MRPLLMIPGPVEVSAQVAKAVSGHAPAHLAPHVIEAFGGSLEMMREVWQAHATSQPFIVSGGGTTAMDMAATNVVDATDHVLVINTGYFGDRAAEMLARRGARITQLRCEHGQIPTHDEVVAAVKKHAPTVVWATHVDTSTGVRTEASSIALAAKEAGALVIFDGVCATAGEAFEMANYDVDIYLTASQKAIGLPPGLALLVASQAAMSKRNALTLPPPMSLDFLQWLPIMKAYEAREKSYFSTPNTSLILGLEQALGVITERGIVPTIARHQTVADAFRKAWTAMGLEILPATDGFAANTLSAVYYPEGVDAGFLPGVAERGAIIAGGLHPDLKTRYFRVGHMGHTVFRNDWLMQTIRAIHGGLGAAGHSTDSSIIDEFESWISQN